MEDIPSILGPINVGTSFMIVSIQNNKPYILNGQTGSSGINYYWEGNAGVIQRSRTIGIFSGNGTLDNLQIIDNINRGGIGFIDNNIVTNTRTPANIKLLQNVYANPLAPEIFLSAVVYTLYNSDNVIANIRTSNNSTIPGNNIILLPVTWYFNCRNNGEYNVINTPINSIVNWFCLVDGGITGCGDVSIATGGWTRLNDCTVGNKYNYCLVNTKCGTANCNGPCDTNYYDCTYNSNNGQYVCMFNPEEYIERTQWWTSPYFIGISVGLLLFIIVIIILIFIVGRS